MLTFLKSGRGVIRDVSREEREPCTLLYSNTIGHEDLMLQFFVISMTVIVSIIVHFEGEMLFSLIILPTFSDNFHRVLS